MFLHDGLIHLQRTVYYCQRATKTWSKERRHVLLLASDSIRFGGICIISILAIVPWNLITSRSLLTSHEIAVVIAQLVSSHLSVAWLTTCSSQAHVSVHNWPAELTSPGLQKGSLDDSSVSHQPHLGAFIYLWGSLCAPPKVMHMCNTTSCFVPCKQCATHTPARSPIPQQPLFSEAWSPGLLGLWWGGGLMHFCSYFNSTRNFLVISKGNLTQIRPENLHSLRYSHPANLCAVDIIAAWTWRPGRKRREEGKR